MKISIKKMLYIAGVLVFIISVMMPAAVFASDDLNGDGLPDIVFSNVYNGSTRKINSYIYEGDETMPYSQKIELATSAAQGNSIADLNGDGYMDIVFSNYTNDVTNNINSYIYWGAETGAYSQKTELATSGAYGNSVADLNGDGYMDIVFSNRYDGSSYNINSYIYWGAETGAYSQKTELVTVGAYGNSVADLNGDGYMDIVFSNRNNGAAYNINSYVYWGDGTGDYSQKTELATSGAHDSSIADLNGDGYMDIVFSNYYNGSMHNVNSYIYWGAETEAYSQKTELATSAATANSIADLNGDGYQDIVFSNSLGVTRNTNSYIYWGAETSPYSQKTELATSGAYGNSIGDLNGDGYLDIIFSNLTNGSTYNINSYIYWGAETEAYSQKTDLFTSGAVGVSIAGGNIISGNTAFGTVIPLWVTQGGYDLDVITSPEYQLIATKNELLNEGALDLSDEDIALLAGLYFDAGGTVIIDDMEWSYFSGDAPDGLPHEFGDTGYVDGTYFFYMGSGVMGTPLGSVPEVPVGVIPVVGALCGIGAIAVRRKRFV